MRAAFTLTVLCLALFYTYTAFTGLNFLSSAGRLGPGFFPRIIGLLLVVACLYTLTVESRGEQPEREDTTRWGTAIGMTALTGGFVVSLQILGGILAMVTFMLVALSVLNRGRYVQNVLLSLALPAAIYVIFDVWLNASMPQGIVRLPI